MRYKITFTNKENSNKRFTYESEKLPLLKDLGYGVVVNFDNVYFTLNDWDIVIENI